MKNHRQYNRILQDDGGRKYFAGDGTLVIDEIDQQVIRGWINKAVETAVQDAVAHLVAELNEAYQTMSDLECQVEVNKNSWLFKDQRVYPKRRGNF